MQMPFTPSWTPLQKWLIVVTGLVAIALSGIGIFRYERFHRGPDESFFVGTWRGEYDPHSLYMGPANVSFRFRPDHTYDAWDGFTPSGKWYAGGDFLYLRLRLDNGGDPYDRLEMWHIDSMTPAELRMHFGTMYVVLKRAE